MNNARNARSGNSSGNNPEFDPDNNGEQVTNNSNVLVLTDDQAFSASREESIEVNLDDFKLTHDDTDKIELVIGENKSPIICSIDPRDHNGVLWTNTVQKFSTGEVSRNSNIIPLGTEYIKYSSGNLVMRVRSTVAFDIAEGKWKSFPNTEGFMFPINQIWHEKVGLVLARFAFKQLYGWMTGNIPIPPEEANLAKYIQEQRLNFPVTERNLQNLQAFLSNVKPIGTNRRLTPEEVSRPRYSNNGQQNPTVYSVRKPI